MWFGQISVLKVLIFTKLWRTESQTEYFSLDFLDIQIPNHGPNQINENFQTESESESNIIYF